MGFLVSLRDALWSVPTVIVLSAFGLYFTIKLGVYKPSFVPNAFKQTFFSLKKSDNGGISSLAALSTALGGTVGVGSISGVALAISLGGAGSIFWMWICSFLGMGLKYAEVALAHSMRVKTARGYTGGAMYCLQSLGNKGLGTAFAWLTVLAAVSGGSLVQADAISNALTGCFNSKTLLALTISIITFFVVSGGRKWITAFNTVALPSVSVAFIALCIGFIAINAGRLPSVLARIFGEALGLRQAAGGISGAVMIRVGCTRGTFSNEAGMGSSPLSYSAGAEKSSHIQGLWGVTEVFIDSFAVSTLVALSLLCADTHNVAELFTSSLGVIGAVFYIVSICIFAFAAIISWCFYGEEALYYLHPKGGILFYVFRAGVAICAFAGALMTENGAFAAADIWSALMLFPNLYLLFRSRSDIIALAKRNNG